MMLKKSFDTSSDSTTDSLTRGKRNTQLLLIATVAVFVIWALTAELDMVVSARGEIIQESDIEKIQHLEGGILEELLVKEGDVVFEGQEIARLKAQDRSSELDTIEQELLAFQFEIEKYKSLIHEYDPDFSFAEDQPDMVNLFREKWRQEYEKNLSIDEVIEHDINHKSHLIASMQKRKRSSESQLKLISEQNIIKETLHKEEMLSYIDVLNSRVQEMNMMREIQNLDEAILNEEFSQEKLKKQLIENRNNRRDEYMNKLVEAEKSHSTRQKDLPRVQDRVDRLRVFSPVYGYVDKLHYNFISAVIPPGEGIADITPLKGGMVAEAKIPRKDIGFIEVGQSVRLKVDTYPFTKYGMINGKILSISRSVYEEKEEMFYITIISLEKNFLERGGQQYFISQGMELVADIKTGSRHLVEYAFKPIVIAIEDAFDER